MNSIKLTTFFLFAALIAAQAQNITLGSLLTEMTDRTALTRTPDPLFTVGQASSYDRRSEPENGDFWFANADRTQFVRYEDTPNGTEWVLMDEQGPGAIVRWWMTFAGENSGEGTLRIYIDGATKPIVEGTAFDILSGGVLVGPPLSTSVSQRTEYHQRGHNLYLPIPYGQSIKVTYQSDQIDKRDTFDQLGKKEAVYYNINYRTYAKGTTVESFSPKVLQKWMDQVYQTQLTLENPFHTDQANNSIPEATAALRKLAPGESLTLRMTGEKMISRLATYIQSENIHQALRGVVIEATFDNRKTLRVPIGEFFGTGYRVSPYQTYYTKVEADGRMSAFWPMPFQRQAELTFKNEGNVPVTITELEVHTDAYEWDGARSMHFGGAWQHFYNKMAGAKEDPEDLHFADLTGVGTYVGDVVTLYNDQAAWWGEGDEKFYIDGEDFPSHFGTGTEDYYGYAWSRPEVFDHPLIAQPDGRGNLQKGTATNLRWRALDAVPFTNSLKVDMELWHWAKASVDYAPAVFYYLRPGATNNLDDFTAADVQRTLRFAPQRNSTPKLVKGVVEGEGLEITRLDAGIARPQSWTDSQWSGDAQLWWRRAGVGDTLSLGFHIEEAQTADVQLVLTRAIDYAQVELQLNGGDIISFDGYHQPLTTEALHLQSVPLRKGENRLHITITGKHPDAKPGYMFGIDRIEIK